MTDNVINLQAASKPVTPIDQEAISTLRLILTKAEAGEIQGVAVVTVETDGAGSLLGVGSVYSGEGIKQNIHAAIGAVEALKYRMVSQCLEW